MIRFNLIRERTADQVAFMSGGSAAVEQVAAMERVNSRPRPPHIIDLEAGLKTYAKKTECMYTAALHASDAYHSSVNVIQDSRDLQFAMLLMTGCAHDLEPLRGYFAPPTIQAKTKASETTTLVARPEIKHCILPRKHCQHPTLSLRYNSKVTEALQPILVQCVFQCRILLEQSQNFATLKHWIKFPAIEFPQWEDYFAISWGDPGEMAIYIHHVGDTPFTLGDCVAVLAKTEKT